MISAIAWLPLRTSPTTPRDALENELGLSAAHESIDFEDGVYSGSGEDDCSREQDELTFQEEKADLSGSIVRYDEAVSHALNESSRTAGHKAEGLDAALAELDMDKYDDDDGEDVNATRIFGAGRTSHYVTNDEDPYMTIKDSEDEEAEDYPDDYSLRSSDLLMLAARADEDVSHLEVYVYEESMIGEVPESNLYCHHDILLPAFPLCLSPIGCPSSEDSQSQHNLVAVGTMYPGIEIWDLDLIDSIEPLTTLGGYSRDAISHGQVSCDLTTNKSSSCQQVKSTRGSSAGRRKDSESGAPKLQTSSHSDAILGLSWNYQFRNLLASASADYTVKVWDITTNSVKYTMKHHRDKVQAVDWNPIEPTVLLTGGFDSCIAIVDIRAPENAALKWDVGADVECAVWQLGKSTKIIVSNEKGLVTCLDTRKGEGSLPLFSLAAHESATTSLSISPGTPTLVASCSTDKTVKLWDITNDEPSLVAQKDPDVGAIFSVGFSTSVPYLIGCAGSKGEVAVWDILTEKAVSQGPHGATLQKYNRAAALGIIKEFVI
ncbi:uncharacterized protein MICPUCDRAFT_55318 [Micromonas pusilla CCMP1545]|jgi:periodic tryptophan protein 1|uniref:Predicted protein n=2 Tax=Micromonas pusilla TaxID=38833 RepID=C1MKF4_MICPC|nr:uncharacterized protein MICPUCDRAFT_55318 [Micromonas pusilla CCMP1545]EEH59363.1 predicted protein [Micromonas pusilla CCMP1545]|eukprot:XP_003055987.1 predicted protein [Micromonas pusilla CCMP1545]